MEIKSLIHRLGDVLYERPWRSFAVFGLVCASLAWTLAPANATRSPAQSTAPAAVASSAAVSQPMQTDHNDQSALISRMDKLEERERALYALSLEASRKTLDWWFSFLGVLTALIGIGGALIPYLIGRKNAELLKVEIEAIKKSRLTAEQHVDEILKLREVASQFSSEDRADASASDASQNVQAVQAATTLAQSSGSTEQDRLRAQAIKASLDKDPTTADAEKAYELWFALTVLNPDSSKEHFNAGYWAQQLFKRQSADKAQRSRWFETLQKHYQRCFEINPKSNSTAYNWGIALAAEAHALKDQDLSEARRLWALAGEKYAQALAIHPQKHEAAYNWGIALAAEARALKDQDLSEARRLWALAGEKYAQALAIHPQMHEAANNWGIALDDEARVLKDQDLSEARRLWEQAGEKYAQALAIQPKMHGAAYNWGIALAAEAHALKDQDLSEARRLWALAGEKYAQALAIHPQKHEAANNWGSALLYEVQALKAHDPADEATRQGLLTQAAELLERHAAMGLSGRDAVAYNLACVYSWQSRLADALAQLDICRLAKKLPDHWRSDPGLAPLRDSPAYRAWFAQHFSDTPQGH